MKLASNIYDALQWSSGESAKLVTQDEIEAIQADAQAALTRERDELKADRDRLNVKVAHLENALEVTDELRAKVEALEILNALWSATFQKYESWFANSVPATKYPQAVIADYRKLAAMKGQP